MISMDSLVNSSGPSDIVKTLDSFLPHLSRDERLAVNEVVMYYIINDNIADLFALANGISLRELLARYNSRAVGGPVSIVAKGESDGMKYRLYAAKDENEKKSTDNQIRTDL